MPEEASDAAVHGLDPRSALVSDSELKTQSESVNADASLEEPGELPMNSGGARWRRRVSLAGVLVALFAAGVVLPPLINIGRYQRQVTALVSRSLGRPVHLRSVDLRLLPRPGFVLHDLQVSEDPNFGAEPVLSASSVVASIRILSLWRGRLEIDRISVDEASLNLVRSAQGRWNLESLMLGGMAGVARTQGKAAGGKPARFPYLEATNSQVNLKRGLEKSPYSIVDTDLSLWQDEPGVWRVRLRGQPVRTDIPMSLGDTGEVRMEATLHSAAQLRDMPLKLEAEWREAQLGQLSRLLTGSDAGWRGNVTADMQVQGTLDAAETKTRLRATGVRREEFAPETPLDFDANCGFRYQHSQNALRDIDCDTAIGNGLIHLQAELPGNAGSPEATLDVKQVPLQAGLDLLRTLRSGFAPGITARGTANGSLTYKKALPAEKGTEVKRPLPLASVRKGRGKPGVGEPAANDLQGAITVDGASFRGGELKDVLVLPKMSWSPIPVSNAMAAGVKAEPVGLRTQFTLVLAPVLSAAARTEATAARPAESPKPDAKPGAKEGTIASPKAGAQSAVSPQAIVVRLGLDGHGYDAAISGTAGTAKLRDLAYAFGLPHLDAADDFADDAADFDLTAEGPWIVSPDLVAAPEPAFSAPAAIADGDAAKLQSSVVAHPGVDSFSGSVRLRSTEWKPSWLTRAVDLKQAGIAFTGNKISMTSNFSYGDAKELGKAPVQPKASGQAADHDGGRDGAEGGDSPVARLEGAVTLNADLGCKAADCSPRVQLRFGALDAGVVEAALEGAPERKTLLSPLIDRMRPAEAPKWPAVTVEVQAESLVLGPATLQNPRLQLKLETGEATLESWQAGALGGEAKGTGHFKWNAEKPEYEFDGTFTGLDSAAVGDLLGAALAGGQIGGGGKVQLSGLTSKELAASATGDVQFNWARGAMTVGDEKQVRFDRWKGALSIHGGKMQLGENALVSGRRSNSVAGSVAFGGPAKLTIGPVLGKVAEGATKARGGVKQSANVK